MNAATIYAQEFARCARSPEWKAGALRGLQCALGEAQPLKRTPYEGGTAQYDAWAAGIQAGLAEGQVIHGRSSSQRVAEAIARVLGKPVSAVFPKKTSLRRTKVAA